MPRYFFDIDDGKAAMRDSEGSDLPDAASAQHEAIETLTQMARDSFSSTGGAAFSIVIRDEDDLVLRRLRLALSIEAG